MDLLGKMRSALKTATASRSDVLAEKVVDAAMGATEILFQKLGHQTLSADPKMVGLISLEFLCLYLHRLERLVKTTAAGLPPNFLDTLSEGVADHYADQMWAGNKKQFQEFFKAKYADRARYYGVYKIFAYDDAPMSTNTVIWAFGKLISENLRRENDSIIISAASQVQEEVFKGHNLAGALKDRAK
jgi:hypothetical protein